MLEFLQTESLVIPTGHGEDILATRRKRHAHMQIDEDSVGVSIYVDVYDSRIKDPDHSLIETDSFENSAMGFIEAMMFLRVYKSGGRKPTISVEG